MHSPRAEAALAAELYYSLPVSPARAPLAPSDPFIIVRAEDGKVRQSESATFAQLKWASYSSPSAMLDCTTIAIKDKKHYQQIA